MFSNRVKLITVFLLGKEIMTLIVYHCNTSYASQKLRLYLAEKGLSWEPRHIDLRKQEQITSNYREINPRGTVPAIQDGEWIVCGSSDAMIYLEETHPEHPLLSKDSITRQKQIAFCYAHEALHDPHLRLLSYVNVFMNSEKQKTMDVERVLSLAESHPWKRRGDFLKRVIKNEVKSNEIEVAKAAVKGALDEMDALLKCSPSGFLFSDAYSAADAVGTASLFRIKKVGLESSIAEAPRLVAYYDAMRQRPSFSAANML